MWRLGPIALVLAAIIVAPRDPPLPGSIQRGIVMAVADEASGPGHTDPLPGPRDPEIAVREQFDAAVAAGSADALALFIARNQGHPQTAEAQRMLDWIRAEQK
jgi:hypothetical protein